MTKYFSDFYQNFLFRDLILLHVHVLNFVDHLLFRTCPLLRHLRVYPAY